MDYGSELAKYPDLPEDERQELEKLSNLQKDIAIAGSAEDFIRHPFFKTFENHINDVIADTKGEFLKIENLADLQAYKARVTALQELKQWLNSKVMSGRIAKQAIDIYEQDTAEMNEQIEAAVTKNQVDS